jgi:cytochrome c553
VTKLERLAAALATLALPLLATGAEASRLVADTPAVVASETSSTRSLSRSVVLLAGDVASFAVSGITGTLTLSNSNPAVVSAALAGATLTVTALAPGKASLVVKSGRKSRLKTVVTVKAPMSVAPTSLAVPVGESAKAKVSSPSGSVVATSADTAVATVQVDGESVVVRGRAAGATTVTVRDSRTTRTVGVTVTSPGGGPGGGGGTVSGTTEGRLLASNCFQCHGTYGSGGFDRISGKSETELLEELNEFLAGEEDPGGIMAAHLQGYTAAQLEAIARYLSRP